MFIFCLCGVGYWIRVNKVQKVKGKNMLPKYVGSFTAEVRSVYFFQISSPFRGILRRNSEAITAHLIAFRGPRYTNSFTLEVVSHYTQTFAQRCF